MAPPPSAAGRRPPEHPVEAAAACIQKHLDALVTAASVHPLLRQFLALRSHFGDFVKVQQREAKSSSPLSSHGFAVVLGDSVAGLVVANGVSNFLNLYNSLLVIRLVLTWFPNTPPAIVSPLSTLCDPYLNIFRGIIPPLGGTLDLSPILAFIVLNAFTSTAAALPAELPSSPASRKSITSSAGPLRFSLTDSQRKWARRMFSRRSGDTEEEE